MTAFQKIELLCVTKAEILQSGVGMFCQDNSFEVGRTWISNFFFLLFSV